MKPNIVLLISDALRPKDLSLYGRGAEFDPHLKKIASESIVFENNFSVSNASDSSVTALFSGQYPPTSGFIHQHPFMKKEELDKLKKNKFWLPIYLKSIGYKTISATPLHLWFKKGFDVYSDKDQLKSGKFLDSPLIKRFLLALPNWAYKLGKKLVKWRASPQFYPCTKVVDFAISQIKESQQPFFLFAHMVDTHYPYPIAEIKKLNQGTSVEKILKTINVPKQREYIKKRFFDIGAKYNEEIENKRDNSIWVADKEIWKLYSYLKKKSLLDNTLFIILSDHGDNFGEHSIYFCRGGLYDTSIHVPLIMHVPKYKSGRVGSLTQSIDITPTILEIIGGGKKKLDGKSLIQLIKTGKAVREKIISFDGFCDDRIAERTKKTKRIRTNGVGVCYLCGAVHHKEKNEKYNLTRDKDELNNIYVQSE